MSVRRRLYRLSLYLLPPSFRREYGQELESEAAALLASAGFTAPLRLAGDWISMFLREWSDAVSGWARGQSGSLAGDLRVAIRSLGRAPVFTTAVTLTLALGLAASTVSFGLVDAFLLRSLPYPEPEELVVLWPTQNWSRAMVDEASTGRLPSLEGVAGIGGGTLILQDVGEPREVPVLQITPNLHDLLGVRPVLGRGFRPEDGAPGAEAVVLLSHALWASEFRSDPGVIGRSVALGGMGAGRRTVVGVMGLDHRPIRSAGAADAWIPVISDPGEDSYTNSYFMTGLGRLSEDASVSRASRELGAWAELLREADPGWFSPEEVALASATRWSRYRNEDLQLPLLASLGAAILILLVACANVASLLLARVAGQGRALSVRAALGAGAGRRARGIAAEVTLLALLGGMVGLLLAWGLESALGRALPGLLPDPGTLLSMRTALATGGLVAGAALLAGVLPCIHAARRDPARALSGGRGSRITPGLLRVLGGLSALQLAAAMAGVALAGLLGRSLTALDGVDPGFVADQTLTFRITAPPLRYPDDPAVTAYYREVRGALLSVPGVVEAGFGSRLPLGGGQSIISVYPEGWEGEEGQALPEVWHRLTTPGYLEALGVRLLAGRIPGPEDDRDDEPLLAVINRAAAERFWPGEDPVGKTFLGRGGVVYLTVAGVVDDVRENGPRDAVEPGVFVPHRDWPWRSMHAVVRSRSNDPELLEVLKEAVWSVSPGVPVTRVTTLAAVADRGLRPTRLLGVLALLTGVVTLLLGATGVYGVVSQAVTCRRGELGVRAALGATGARLLHGELRRSLAILVPGAVLGLFGAWAGARGIRSLLFGVSPLDPLVLAGALAVLTGVVLVAAWLPARRAARVDPASVLQSE